MNTKEEIEEHQKQCDERRKLWGDGAWKDEPDRLEFQHAGFQCLLSRNPGLGNWCGYVGLTEGHPAYGKDYNDVEVEVHGGLTYAEQCRGPICHITEKEDSLFWLGFDCAHGGDLLPATNFTESLFPVGLRLFRGHERYKDIQYVRRETELLAEQLSQMRA